MNERGGGGGEGEFMECGREGLVFYVSLRW